MSTMSRAALAFDPARFEIIHRIATVMADCTLLSDALCMEVTEKNGRKETTPLPQSRVYANCFLVTNQAFLWGMDPFAVAQCVSIVKGKLCYEGKLVAAVLDAVGGVELHHYFTGEGEQMRIFLADKELSQEQIAGLKKNVQFHGIRMVDGSVSEWKTTHTGSPWTPNAYRRQLIYRGSREWARLNKPSVILGVAVDDELRDIADEARFGSAKMIEGDAGLLARLQQQRADALPPPDATSGFSMPNIERELAPVSKPISQPSQARNASAPAGANKGGSHDQGLAAATHGDRKRESTSPIQTRETGGLDASVTSAGGEQPATDIPSSPPLNGEKEGEASAPPNAAGVSSSKTLSAEQFQTYSNHLGRATKLESLNGLDRQAGDKLVAQIGGKPAQRDIELLQAIFGLHLKRVNGELDASVIADEVEALISKHFGVA